MLWQGFTRRTNLQMNRKNTFVVKIWNQDSTFGVIMSTNVTLSFRDLTFLSSFVADWLVEITMYPASHWDGCMVSGCLVLPFGLKFLPTMSSIFSCCHDNPHWSERYPWSPAAQRENPILTGGLPGATEPPPPESHYSCIYVSIDRSPHLHDAELWNVNTRAQH